MRILLANYRYFISGGPERYMFNLIEALDHRGHEVVPFSIRYRYNRPTCYSSYFVEPLGSDDEVTFAEQSLRFNTIKNSLLRLFYAKDVERAVQSLAAKTNPDVAYVLHYLRKLSPSVLVGIKKLGMPIVVRLSDYAMVCPQADLAKEGHPCEACIQGGLWPSVKHRCIHNSLTLSSLNAIATYYHRWKKYFDLVDLFVVTNDFMRAIMIKAGYSEDRLVCIPTFVNTMKFHPGANGKQNGLIAYNGRLNFRKGAHVLVEALGLLRNRCPELHWELQIAGFGEAEYIHRLKARVRQLGIADRARFLGKLEVPELSSLLARASFSVVPSIWYENLPNALLESYAAGTPVLASSLGSLVECVEDGETGFLFQSGNPSDLSGKIMHSLLHPGNMAEMGSRAAEVATTKYSEERHLRMLEGVFARVISKK